jgi:putative CRISPR-associated protein (TIGR02619 family)
MTNCLLLLSTCGTSLLTNLETSEDRRWFTEIANKPKLSDQEQDRLQRLVEKKRSRLETADDVVQRQMSAELNGIAGVRKYFQSGRIHHLLVHSDTAVGLAAAELVKGSIEHRKESCEFLTASGLRTDDAATFREALADLTKDLESRTSDYRQKKWTIVFNLTGGFKSVNAYLQALGMIYADRTVFLFEGADDLMQVPRLPIRLVEADVVRPHLTIFRKLAVGFPVEASEAQGAPESLLMEIDGKVTTSVWGDVVWARVEKELLQAELLNPLSLKLTFSKEVGRAWNALESDRKFQVNQAFDELSAYLEANRPLLKGRTFKTLQGSHLPSTHELYLWSDGNAARALGHFDDACFVVDKISKHL